MRWLLVVAVAVCSCRPPTTTGVDSSLRLEATSLSFGDVYVGATKTLTVGLVNEGRASATFTATTGAPFSLVSPGQLGGGDRVELTVTFTPTAPGAVTGEVVVSDTLRIALDATGVAQPECLPTACTSSVFSLEEGRCVVTALTDDTPCDPGCQATGVCVAGVCRATNAGSCDDGNPCTVDACGADGGCVALPRECPVTSGCMVASCEPATGCIETPLEDGVVCGDPTCAEARICINGQCETRSRPDAVAQCTYVDVTVNHYTACAKNLAGVTRCWGGNERDQLLRGAATVSVGPADWPIGFEVASFINGPHTCAIDSVGHLRCPNLYDGGDTLYRSFDSPNGLCGVLTDGGLSQCLGLSVAARAQLTPAVRTWGTQNFLVTQCAQAVDGGVGCWGTLSNFAPDAGGFTMLASEPPVDLYVAEEGVWALLVDGGVRALGPSAGKLRDLPETDQPWSAMSVDDTSDFVSGVLADGTVELCRWFGNAEPTPRACHPLAGQHAFTRLRSGSVATCGLDVDGGVWCWGNNQYGQLGDPAVAQAPRALMQSDVLARSGQLSCFLDGGCTWRLFEGTLLITPPGPVDDVCGTGLVSLGSFWSVDPFSGAVSLSFADAGAVCEPATVSGNSEGWRCTLHDDGGVGCSVQPERWLGDGGTAYVVDEPVAMPAMSRVRSADNALCGLTTAGRVWCWGRSIGYPTPALVPLVGVRQLECLSGACCALHGTNGVSCWGDNSSNQLGANGTNSTTPRAVSITEPVTKLSHDARCALLTSGRVRCWSYAGSEAPYTSWEPLQVTR